MVACIEGGGTTSIFFAWLRVMGQYRLSKYLIVLYNQKYRFRRNIGLNSIIAVNVIFGCNEDIESRSLIQTLAT